MILHSLYERAMQSVKEKAGLGRRTFRGHANTLYRSACCRLWLMHRAMTIPSSAVCLCCLPIIPLSLLSRVELGLLMVSQGLLLAAVLLTQLFKVEQGLSVLGDAVLLVSVEQGLMPWLRAVHCKMNGRRS